MPTDIEILEFIYARMNNIHGENEHYDYMIHFRDAIEHIKNGDLIDRLNKIDELLDKFVSNVRKVIVGKKVA